MKEVSHKKAYVRNPDTGEFEPLMAIRGESAYDIAVRLGKFTGTEEEWANYIEIERAAAVKSVEDKGAETLASIPDDYTALAEAVDKSSANAKFYHLTDGYISKIPAEDMEAKFIDLNTGEDTDTYSTQIVRTKNGIFYDDEFCFSITPENPYDNGIIYVFKYSKADGSYIGAESIERPKGVILPKSEDYKYRFAWAIYHNGAFVHLNTLDGYTGSENVQRFFANAFNKSNFKKSVENSARLFKVGIDKATEHLSYGYISKIPFDDMEQHFIDFETGEDIQYPGLVRTKSGVFYDDEFCFSVSPKNNYLTSIVYVFKYNKSDSSYIGVEQIENPKGIILPKSNEYKYRFAWGIHDGTSFINLNTLDGYTSAENVNRFFFNTYNKAEFAKQTEDNKQRLECLDYGYNSKILADDMEQHFIDFETGEDKVYQQLVRTKNGIFYDDGYFSTTENNTYPSSTVYVFRYNKSDGAYVDTKGFENPNGVIVHKSNEYKYRFAWGIHDGTNFVNLNTLDGYTGAENVQRFFLNLHDIAKFVDVFNVNTTKKFTGKIANIVGDSITVQNRLNVYLERAFGFTLNKFGVSGCSLANTHEESVCNRILTSGTIPDADLWIIYAGVNDLVSGTLGTFLDSDNTTVYGGVKAIIEAIHARGNNAKVVFLTPLQSGRNEGLSITLKDLTNAIIETCEYYSVPYLNLRAKGGFNSLNIGDTSNPNFTTDTVHPSAKGTAAYAPVVIDFLNGIDLSYQDI